MLKRFLAGLCALTCLSLPALSAGSCEPGTLAAAIDRYTDQPFGPVAWRVVRGLGDPRVEMDYPGTDEWSKKDDWKKLVADLGVQGQYLLDPGYDCRVGYPLQVLQERVKSLGRDSIYLKQWLRVQNTVFEACSAEGGALTLPEPVEVDPALAKLQQQDRAYQEASVAFYRDKSKAVALFKAIGASDSPHRAAARYNVANLLANAKDLNGARAEANAILADASLASVHGITRALLGYISNIEDTAEGWTRLVSDTMAALERPLADINGNPDARREYAFAQFDIGHAGVDSKDDDWWLDGKLPENPTLSKAISDLAQTNPGVLWMIAGQSANQYYDALPWSLAGQKFAERVGTLMSKALSKPAASGLKWPARDMLTAMVSGPDKSADLWTEAKLAAVGAKSACGENPETAAAGLLLAQATRASALAAKYDEIYANLATVPFPGSRAYAERTVLKLGEYLMGQGDLKEARRYRDTLLTADFFAKLPEEGRDGLVDRFAGLMGWMAEDEAHWKAALALGGYRTANALLNFQPAKTLRALADDPMFDENQKALLTRAAWTRDLVLGRKIAAADTDRMLALNPPLKALAEKSAADYPKADPARAQLLTMLRSPRYGILINSPDTYDPIEMKRDDFNEIESWDVNDKNWWCPLETDRLVGAVRSQYDAAVGVGFLAPDGYGQERYGAVLDAKLLAGLAGSRDRVLKGHPLVKAISWKEVAALAAAPSGPKFLSRRAIAWGKASNGDDGAPEALALAVRSTRYGCRWHGSHADYSKGAQELLKAKFGDTSFAKATPYWFGCMWMVWDKDFNRVAECKSKTWPKQAPLK